MTAESVNNGMRGAPNVMRGPCTLRFVRAGRARPDLARDVWGPALTRAAHEHPTKHGEGVMHNAIVTTLGKNAAGVLLAVAMVAAASGARAQTKEVEVGLIAPMSGPWARQ